MPLDCESVCAVKGYGREQDQGNAKIGDVREDRNVEPHLQTIKAIISGGVRVSLKEKV
jgi:hypothetical protein